MRSLQAGPADHQVTGIDREAFNMPATCGRSSGSFVRVSAMNIVLEIGFDEGDVMLAGLGQRDANHIERDARKVAIGDSVEDSVADDVIGDQYVIWRSR
ncbi:hypothetical protein [Burkholderia pseudomultivorans]|nr:hypothetical protein [Burkholderia pseudomultivorans]